MAHFSETSSCQILFQSQKNGSVILLTLNKFLPAGQQIVQLIDSTVFEYKVVQLVDQLV